ncbi:hypothetical protein F5X68DRAFT_13141 [Plectosphaerella plurivora]|uniref:Uncharacterized protein n=1 Tax=Plectosphaerella plurivora TaxID=936078 RepID=A0A9P8VAR4_9PEZI|nr:hypothetical protein F5X68DRAFT_13141 [Plectosphaerella plurivora]
MSVTEPAWGALPVEQYLLQKWNPDSPLSTDEQRTKLVRAYIQEDVIGPEFDPARTNGVMVHAPTQDEIALILEPWRSQKLRSIAAKHLKATGMCHDFYFLRTNYAGGEEDGAKLRDWIEFNRDEGFCSMDPDDEWWRILSDVEIFNVDDDDDWNDWRKVYDILPELAAPESQRGFTTSDIADVHEALEARFGSPEAVKVGTCEDDYEDAIKDMAASGQFLVVLDRLAFETGELRLLFRDRKGHVVKECGIEAEELGELVNYCELRSMGESQWWLGAGTGKRYGPKGRIMKGLMRRVMDHGGSSS